MVLCGGGEDQTTAATPVLSSSYLQCRSDEGGITECFNHISTALCSLFVTKLRLSSIHNTLTTQLTTVHSKLLNEYFTF